MLRNIFFKKKCSTHLIFNSFVNNARGIHTKANDESFNKLWSMMTETSRKIAALNTSFPENAEILLYRGHAYREMGEYGSAITSYREAMEKDSKYADKAKKEIEEIEDLVGNRFSLK